MKIYPRNICRSNALATGNFKINEDDLPSVLIIAWKVHLVYIYIYIYIPKIYFSIRKLNFHASSLFYWKFYAFFSKSNQAYSTDLSDKRILEFCTYEWHLWMFKIIKKFIPEWNLKQLHYYHYNICHKYHRMWANYCHQL